MRLTLRTLLAWLDDTLPPSQVREIGKQVSESTYAQELVEKIHRVCRQRRLTVPSKNGPEATDPNIVAGYVDNDLDPEQVTEYEKKCLTSDVNLAEAACVHQILSLLGQKVHVPPEAKARMYQLVKGRESTSGPRPDGSRPKPPEPVTKPIQPWVAPEPPPRPWLERYGPALACLALIGVLSWSAYHSLTLTTSEMAPVHPASDAGAEAAWVPHGEGAADREGIGAELAGKPDEEAAAPAPLADTEERPVTPEPAPERPSPSIEATAKAIPAGAVGVVEGIDGVLIRYNSEKREWERVARGAALATGDHLICLAPFRSRLVVGPVAIRLIGEAEIRVLSKGPAETPAFELVFGRAVVESAPAPGPVRVEFSGQSLIVERDPEQRVGLEHAAAWSFGRPPTGPAPLLIHAVNGEVRLTRDQAKEVLHGPGSIRAEAAGRLESLEAKAVPDWVTAPELSEKEQKLIESFAQLFSQEGHVLADIVSATENESAVNKKYAIFAVKALGDLTFLVPILSRARDPLARQSAIAAVREFLAQGTEAARRLGEPLDEEFGEAPARVIQRLLVGYPPEEAAKREVLDRLLDQLSSREPSLAIRELALDNLMRITGKPDQGYDPENPNDAALSAWKALVGKGETRPAPRRKPAE